MLVREKLYVSVRESEALRLFGRALATRGMVREGPVFFFFCFLGPMSGDTNHMNRTHLFRSAPERLAENAKLPHGFGH